MKIFDRYSWLTLSVSLLMTVAASAWDYEGHRTINQLALKALPADFPAFVREPANAERVAFLSGEPDRWRNTADLPIKHFNGVDHYCDLEQLTEAGLTPATVSALRYEFALQFAAGRAAHAANFPLLDPTKNQDRTREWPGFAPWAIAEYYGKLKSAFSYWKAFREAGTPDEIANAQADIVYVMGIMGHYVGDSAQPLHTTKHHNGWVGENPQGYTKWSGLHSWIDSGFIARAGIKFAALAPRVASATPLALAPTADGRDPLFSAVMTYVVTQQKLVEPLYILEKKGALKIDGAGPNAEAKKFIEDRLLVGGDMLARIWLTAWQQAGPDVYLRAQLLKRSVARAKATP
jgi:hypothetical protein